MPAVSFTMVQITTDYKEFWQRANDPQVNQIIQQHYLQGEVRLHESELAMWGDIDEQTGYLQLKRFGGFAGDSQYRPDHDIAFDMMMLEIMLQFKHKEAVIIDVRNNNGGGDNRALRLANWFADREALLYSETSRHQGSYTEQVDFYASPMEDLNFRGKVAVLISPISLSSAEQFAMNMMPFEQAVLIGENTNGAFSQLTRVLSNGWLVGLTNQQVVAADGNDYEVVGIPPDILVSSFTQADFDQQKDSAIEAAISYFAQ